MSRSSEQRRRSRLQVLQQAALQEFSAGVQDVFSLSCRLYTGRQNRPFRCRFFGRGRFLQRLRLTIQLIIIIIGSIHRGARRLTTHPVQSALQRFPADGADLSAIIARPQFPKLGDQTTVRLIRLRVFDAFGAREIASNESDLRGRRRWFLAGDQFARGGQIQAVFADRSDVDRLVDVLVVVVGFRVRVDGCYRCCAARECCLDGRPDFDDFFVFADRFEIPAFHLGGHTVSRI